MTLTSIHCSVIRVMRVLTKQHRPESRGFRYKVALYLRNSSILSDTPASKVKLTSRFGFICSQISQLLRLLTQIYGNEQACDR